jgi:hypothetical protein
MMGPGGKELQFTANPTLEAPMKLRLVYALAATLLFGSLSATDLTITFTSTKKGMGGGSTGTEIHYYSPTFLMTRAVENKQDLLVDFKQGINYNINHPKKTIDKISFDDAMAAMGSLNMPKDDASSKMMATMFGDPNAVKVTRLPNEKIAGRDCQAWEITVGKLVMNLSADPTLKPPIPESSYTQMMKTRAAQFTQSGPMGATYKRLYEEMAKIKGIPLRTHMSGMMGVDVTTLATKIESGAIPAATFVLPTGYKVEDMGKKLREQMAKGKK